MVNRDPPELNAWRNIHSRCRRHPSYAGRGIRVCQRWSIFQNFLDDMGLRPSPMHSLDRINNDGDYEPSNCRWATKSEQRKNQRPMRSFIPRTEAKTLGIALRKARERLGESQKQFAARLGINQATISRWEDHGPLRGPAVLALRQILADIERFLGD